LGGESSRSSGERRGGVDVIVDTNMFMLMGRGLPVLAWIEELLDAKVNVVCTKKALLELEKLSKQGGARGRQAALAMRIAESACSEVVEAEAETADKEIVSVAVERAARGSVVVVATSDRRLRRALRKAGIPTAYYRESQEKLEIERAPLL